MSNLANSFRSSETSIDDSSTSTSAEERNIREFVTQMLKNRLFLGQYQERRRVDILGTYRDVIIVNESEIDLKRDLDVIERRLHNYYGDKDVWIGITDPRNVGAPNGHALWVEFDKSIALGCYWFKIRNVRFRKNEVLIKLKTIRNMNENDTQSIETVCGDFLNNFSWETAFEKTKTMILENIIWFFTTVLTVNNIKDAFRFVSVLLAATFTLLLESSKFFMDFSLKFIHEFSYLVQSFTPVMIAMVNLVGKIVGGFYLLIAMMWRDSKRPMSISSSSPSYQYRVPRYRSIDMPRPRSNVIITEIK